MHYTNNVTIKNNKKVTIAKTNLWDHISNKFAKNSK